jgi:hypothetical protein
MSELTREQVLSMETGRELDALVAEKVMGLQGFRKGTPGYEGWEYIYTSNLGDNQPIPHYSSDLSAAWEVIEKFDNMTFRRGREADGHIRHFAYIWLNSDDDKHEMCKASKMPEAVCKAALMAVMNL